MNLALLHWILWTLRQNLENMPSQCSLTWWCDYRGWVVACLISSQSSGIGKENTLSGARFKVMGRMLKDGVGTVVGRGTSHSCFHFKMTSSSHHRERGKLEGCQVSCNLLRNTDGFSQSLVLWTTTSGSIICSQQRDSPREELTCRTQYSMARACFSTAISCL